MCSVIYWRCITMIYTPAASQCSCSIASVFLVGHDAEFQVEGCRSHCLHLYIHQSAACFPPSTPTPRCWMYSLSRKQTAVPLTSGRHPQPRFNDLMIFFSLYACKSENCGPEPSRWFDPYTFLHSSEV